MKAKVITETPYSPNLKAGQVVEIMPGMETDSEGIWNIPGGRLYLCKTEEGRMEYMFPSCLQILVEDGPSDELRKFRDETARQFAAAIISSHNWHKQMDEIRSTHRYDNYVLFVIKNAILLADVLMRALYPKK